MKKILNVAAAALLIGVATTPIAGVAQETEVVEEEQLSLYERLGGYDAIAAVVDDFANRLVADPALVRHFGGFSDDRLQQFKTFNIQLVCMATGGPCTYEGRSMLKTHQGSRISEADFDQVAANLVATLDHFKVPDRERGELLAIVGSLRGDIVEKDETAE